MVQKVELRTERLLLRPYTFEDVHDVVAYASDDAFARFVPIPRPYTVREGEEFIARAILRDWETAPIFAIVVDGHVSGGINLRIDLTARIAEMGYGLAPWHWGKGLAAEAGATVLEWAFATYWLAKMFARADARNTQSRRVMEKLGMKQEALLRGHVLTGNGERIDDVMYGILREEWEARTR